MSLLSRKRLKSNESDSGGEESSSGLDFGAIAPATPSPAPGAWVEVEDEPFDVERLPQDVGQTFDPERSRVINRPGSGFENISDEGMSPSTSPGPLGGIPDSLAVPPSPQALGDRFLAREIVNKGGFGEVWSARQISLDRTVAVKRIRGDLRNPASDSRRHQLDVFFRREAYTAASLEHPNILPIYDLGSGADGQPMLAMKLVDGDPWNVLIEREFATTPPNAFLTKHLPILIATANAVAYAHHKGIIHRDLKPAQVMVGRFGEVLLMDWGLAMQVSDPIDAPTDGFLPSQGVASSATATNPAGTPAFMAPEQTSTSTRDLGPWTDVYLLGATLYLLLTGTPPHYGGGRVEAFYRAKHSLVMFPEEIAPNRSIPKELSKLAMDAMAKRPIDRIPNVEVFLARLNDYLSGESRRRESEALVAQVEDFIATTEGDYSIYGECVVRLGNARALWSENPKVTELEQRVFAEFATAALRNRDLTLARVKAERLAPGDARETLLAEIVVTTREVARQRVERRVALVGVIVMIVLFAVSGFVFAFEQANARRAAEYARHDAENARTEAEHSLERAEELTDFMLTRLRAQLKPLGRLRLLDEVANGALQYYEAFGNVQLPPESLRKQGLALVNIGDVFRESGRSEEAIKAYERALKRQDAVHQSRPGDIQAGMEAVRTRNAIARVLRTQGNLPGAEEQARMALAASTALITKFPKDEETIREHAASHANLALTRLEQGFVEEAETSIRESLEIVQAGYAKFPSSNNLLIDEAASFSNLGLVLIRNQDLEGALAAQLKALSLRERIDTLQPGNAVNAFNMSRTLMSLVPLHFGSGNAPAARAASLRAQTQLERLVAIDPLNLEWQRGLSAALMTSAEVAARSGEPKEAEESVRKAMGIREQLVRQEGTNAGWLRDLSVSYNRLAELYVEKGDGKAALALYRADLAIAERLAVLDPTNGMWRHDLAVSHQILGEHLLAAGEAPEAETHLLGAVGAFQEIARDEPESLTAANDVAWANVLIGEIRAADGDAEGARAHWLEAQRALEPVLRSAVEPDPGPRDTYARALMHLGRGEEARPWLEGLIAEDWREEGLLALARKQGLLTDGQ